MPSPTRSSSPVHLRWPGKEEAFAEAASEPRGRLVVRDGATSRNAFVVGDNLDVLKLAMPDLRGRAKMIYVDPPYNTGQRLTFVDRFGGGKPGRLHAAWLSMMAPRLVLAREILREDGAIFVSIDDREVHRLRLLLDEIFGEDAFVAELVWPSKKGGGNDVATMIAEHEYVLVYARDRARVKLGTRAKDASPLDEVDARGPYRRGRELNKWGAGSSRADRPTMFFPIPGPNGEDVYPIRNDGSEGRWRRGREAMLELVARGDALFERRTDGTYVVYEKVRAATGGGVPFRTVLDAGPASEGRARLKRLFRGEAPFEFAKPVSLVRRLLAIGAPEPDALVVDFFAGSGTTGDAVLLDNAEHGFSRSFFLVQTAEPIARGRHATVADVAIERLRRAAEDAAEKPVGDLDATFRVSTVERRRRSEPRVVRIRAGAR